MLSNASIFNFKVFKNLENVSLNKITLVGGKNNTGKTTLLEALFAYMDIKNPVVLNRLIGWRGLGPRPAEPELIWAPFFSNFRFDNDIRFEVNLADTTRNLEISFVDAYIPPIPVPINNNGMLTPGASNGNGYKAISLRHKKNGALDYNAHIFLHPNGLSHYIETDISDLLYPVYFIWSEMHNGADNPELLGKLDKEDSQDRVLEFMRKLELGLQRFQLIKEGGRDVIYADFGNKQKVPVEFMGSGFCRCLTIALVLIAGNKKIIFIDEIENGIHYSFLKDFGVSSFAPHREVDCQIIATTHNHDMIQALYNAAVDTDFSDAAYIRLAKKDDIVKAHHFDIDTLYSALVSKIEVR